LSIQFTICENTGGGKFSEKWAGKEEFPRQFGQAMGATQMDQEKRRINKLVCSNSTWKDGRPCVHQGQPVDSLVEKPGAPKKNGHFP
jgi:hypothetical protein